jgi:predicted lipid carrier protein YhbT
MKIPVVLRRLHFSLNELLPSLPFVVGLEIARQFSWLNPPSELNGRHFLLHVKNLSLCLSFKCVDGRFRPALGGPVDLEFTAELGDFLELLRGGMDADTLFFQRRLQIRGNTELGLIVKNWLDAAERPAWLQAFSKGESYDNG